MERLPAVHRERFDGVERLPAAQRETFDGVERLPAAHRETFDAVEHLPAAQRETFDGVERLPAAHQETFDAVEHLPAAQRETFDAVEHLPAAQRERFDGVERLPESLLLARGILRREEMSASAKQPSRFIVVLKLPEYEVPLLVMRARGIVERMTGNSWFPSPLPSLAVVQAAIDDLFDAETKTLTRVMDSVTARDAKRMILVTRLQQLAAYVESIANANPEHGASIVESAGMYLKKTGRPARRASSGRRRPASPER